MTDLPPRPTAGAAGPAEAVIPPGNALLMVPPVCEAVRAERAYSGLMVSRRGQISILLNGAGVSVAMAGPAELRDLANVLSRVADQWEEELRGAAGRADAALARIVQERATDA